MPDNTKPPRSKRTRSRWERVITPIIIGLLSMLIASPVGDYLENRRLKGIRELIDAEAVLSRAYSEGNHEVAEAYGRLFTSDAWIVDVGNRRAEAYGLAEILGRLSRLERISANQHDLYAKPQEVAESEAIAKTTTQLRMPAGGVTGYERWFFRKVDGAWKIKRFEYNLPKDDR